MEKKSKADTIGARRLLAVLKNYRYALLDRRDFNVNISFGNKEITEDEGYSDYNQRLYMEISSISSVWGSRTELQLDVEIPFHVTNEGSVQQSEIESCIIGIWGTRESLSKRLFKIAGIDESHGNIYEVEEDKKILFFQYRTEAVTVCRYLQRTYVAPALLKLTFNNFQ